MLSQFGANPARGVCKLDLCRIAVKSLLFKAGTLRECIVWDNTVRHNSVWSLSLHSKGYLSSTSSSGRRIWRFLSLFLDSTWDTARLSHLSLNRGQSISAFQIKSVEHFINFSWLFRFSLCHEFWLGLVFQLRLRLTLRSEVVLQVQAFDTWNVTFRRHLL